MPFNTKELARDALQNAIPQYFNPDSDTYEVATGSGGALNIRHKNAYSSQDDMLKVSSLQKKWKDSFTGSVLDTDKWEVIQTGSGHTITVGGGELTIATGTTIDTETVLLSKETFTDPVRALFGIYLSQRIANQEFYVELVSVNPTTGVEDNQHGVAWRIAFADSATTTQGVYQVWNGGQARLSSATSNIVNSTTSLNILELELFADEVWFHSRAIDSSSGRSSSFVRHQQIPDPNAVFKIKLRAKNLSTAPATSTNFKMQFITVVDYAELTAEITAGRGNTASGQSIGVQVLNTATVNNNTLSNNTMNTDTTTTLGTSATYTGSGRDAGSTLNYNKMRAIVMHKAGDMPGHLVFEQSHDNTTFRETHRIPIPSDTQYRTFEFPWNLRYCRVKFINGSVAQTSFVLYTCQVRIDGASDLNKMIAFPHSTTALGVSATFTGATLNLGANHSFNQHRVFAYSDQAGTLYIEQSRDGTNWRVTKTQSLTAGTAGEVDSTITLQYIRVRYTNGGVAQTAFELYSSLFNQ